MREVGMGGQAFNTRVDGAYKLRHVERRGATTAERLIVEAIGMGHGNAYLAISSFDGIVKGISVDTHDGYSTFAHMHGASSDLGLDARTWVSADQNDLASWGKQD